MKHLSLLYLILIPFFLISFAACGAKAPPRSTLSEETKSKIIQKTENYLQKNHNYLHSAKGYAKVKLKIKSKKENFDAVILVNLTTLPDHDSAPLRFRFEILDDLGNSRNLIVSDGKTLSWKDFSNEEVHSAELSEKNLRKFLPLANSIEETLGLLIGRIPKANLQLAVIGAAPCRRPDTSDSEEQKEGEPHRITPATQACSLYKISFPQGEILWNDQKQVIEYLALKSKNGKLAFQYEGKNFIHPIVSPTKETTLTIPSQIRLTDLKTKNEIEINYKVIDIGMRLPFSPTLFELEP